MDKEGACGNGNDTPNGERKRRRIPRRNSLSDFDLNIEMEVDADIRSPDHKKIKGTKPDEGEGERKNATFPQMNENEAFICNTETLTKLLSVTKNYGIRKLIECYHLMNENDIELIKKHMLDCSGYGNENIKIYKLAIEFITNNEKEEINETDIGELAEILIAAIKNRMAKHCEDCKNWYIVDRKDKPKNFCVMCKVGQHDCLPENNEKQRYGNKWFCSECNEQFTNQNKQNKCRNIFFKGFEENDETKIIINETIAKLTQKAKDAEANIINIEDEELEQEQKKNEEEKKKKEQEERNKQDEKRRKRKMMVKIIIMIEMEVITIRI